LFGQPHALSAEWHFTPMLGVTFGKGTNLVPFGGATDERDRSYGATVSRLGEGILGFEGGVALTPRFFESERPPNPRLLERTRVATLMGNVVLTTPRLWTEYSLRPFVSGGLGVMDVLIDYPEAGNPFRVDDTAWGFNIGGGAIGFLTDRTGVRFETRYFSTLGRKDFGPVATRDGSQAHLRYFTASVGLVIRTGVR
jgi:hypothetical protein